MFQNITLIQKDDHAELKVGKIDSLEYAKNTTFVPLAIAEFFHACKSQPIVFTKKEQEMSCGALMGLQQDHNLFITSKNQWRVGDYVPFFIRQYPFIYVKTGAVMSLAYDASCKAMNIHKGESLFTKEGEASETARKILDMMDSYQNDMKNTLVFTNKLKELDLLEPFNAQLTRNNQNYGVEGFLRVNEEKFKALSNDTKIELIDNGMYNLIIAHLISLSNFEKLAVLSTL